MITKAFFGQNPLLIPQAKQNNGVPANVYSQETIELDRAIKRYEKEYMVALLGSELYAEYLTDMADEVLKLKWAAFNSHLCDAETLVSPIANFIYFNYVQDNSFSYNGTVYTTEKKENSTILDGAVKLVDVWNKMCDLNYTFIEWLCANPIETTALISTAKWDYLTTEINYYGI